MSFLSPEYFLLFFPMVVVGYFLLNQTRLGQASMIWLIVASLLFYGLGEPRFLPLLIASVLINYVLGCNLKANRPLLFFGLFANVFLLSFFKYPLVHEVFQIFEKVLPLGLSFYTLRQIAFLVDAYEGRVQRVGFIDYLTFVLFFPHLTIGPISQYKAIVPQFHGETSRKPQLSRIAAGLFLFLAGFSKKVFLSGLFQPYADRAFAAPEQLSLLQGWMAGISFTLQLYFDFSGYSDMAIGSALVMNIILPENFNSPLKSRSLIEFWTRWHISLSRFLTTYIYSPILFFSRRPTFALSLFAVFVTFIVSGIWHGGQWTYVTFGFMHASGLTINHVWRRLKLPMLEWLGWLFTFVFVIISNAVFRGSGMRNAFTLVGSLFGRTQPLHMWFVPSDGVQLVKVCLALGGMLMLKNSSYFSGKVAQWIKGLEA